MISLGTRTSYYTGSGQFLYGIKRGLNLGFDVNYRSVRIDSISSTPFLVLNMENSTGSRSAISTAGPKMKVKLFKRSADFSLQSSILFPLRNNMESSPWLDFDSYVFRNQLFFDKELGFHFKIFSELDTWIRINKNGDHKKNNLETPVKGFLSYYPSNKISFYSMIESNPNWGNDFISAYYIQVGAGIKYQFTSILEVELLFTSFILGYNKGAGSTYNIGFRMVR